MESPFSAIHPGRGTGHQNITNHKPAVQVCFPAFAGWQLAASSWSLASGMLLNNSESCPPQLRDGIIFQSPGEEISRNHSTPQLESSQPLRTTPTSPAIKRPKPTPLPHLLHQPSPTQPLDTSQSLHGGASKTTTATWHPPPPDRFLLVKAKKTCHPSRRRREPHRISSRRKHNWGDMPPQLYPPLPSAMRAPR